MVKECYKIMKPPTCIQNLTAEMVQREKKAPKLKAKGAETRHLVPFGLQVESTPNKKSIKTIK